MDLPVTTSLNQSESDGKVVDSCLKSTEQPMELRAGSAIDIYNGVDEDQVDGHLLGAWNKEAVVAIIPGRSEIVTGHPPLMYKRVETTVGISLIHSAESTNIEQKTFTQM